MEESNNAWGNVLFFLFIYFCFEVVTQGIYVVIADISLDGEFILSELEFFSIAIVSAITSTAVVYLFINVSDNMPMKSVGLSFQQRTTDLFYGTLIGAVIMVCGFGILSLLNEVTIKQVNVDASELILSLVGFFAVAYSEELVFRGYILSKLLTKYSAKYSLLFSSLIFAIFHLGNDNLSIMGFVDLVIAGVMLGAFFLYTKNLWMAIGLHFGWNFFQTHLGFNVSGMDSYSIIETTIVESNLLNGGDFGFEGSYLSTMAQVLTLSLLFYFYKKKQTDY